MHTLTLQITSESAMKTIHSLEQKHLVKIVDDADMDSPSLPGAALSLKAFKSWIADAESMSSVSLKDAKTKWSGKRKQLQQLLK
jgi:hypothetical protein